MVHHRRVVVTAAGVCARALPAQGRRDSGELEQTWRVDRDSYTGPVTKADAAARAGACAGGRAGGGGAGPLPEPRTAAECEEMFREYADEWVTSAKAAGGEWVPSSKAADKAADEPPLADDAAGDAAGEGQRAGGRGAAEARPASDTAFARGLRALESRSLFERLQVPLSRPFQACPRLPATVRGEGRGVSD